MFSLLLHAVIKTIAEKNKNPQNVRKLHVPWSNKESILLYLFTLITSNKMSKIRKIIYISTKEKIHWSHKKQNNFLKKYTSKTFFDVNMHRERTELTLSKQPRYPKKLILFIGLVLISAKCDWKAKGWSFVLLRLNSKKQWITKCYQI